MDSRQSLQETVPQPMLRNRLSFGVAIVCAAFAPATAHAGGWTQSEGECYAKLGGRLLIGSGAYLSTGLHDTRRNVVSYADFQLGYYAECGVHDRVTAIVYGAPFGYASADRDTVYVGPLGLAVRFDPIGDGAPTRLALQLDYSFAPPVGDEVLFEEVGATPRKFYQPALSNHAGELSVQLGHGFSASDDVSGWFNFGLGARLNSADTMRHALVFNAQVGLTMWKWFGIEMYFPLVEPFFADIEETNVAGVGRTRYFGFGARLSAWFVPEVAVYAAVDGVFYASSNAATPTLQLGFESRFRAWGDPADD